MDIGNDHKPKIENFIDDVHSKPFSKGVFLREMGEHVKSIYICGAEISGGAYKKSPTYYIGFLSDSNKFTIERYIDMPQGNLKKPGVYRLIKFRTIFCGKNIDSNTDILLNDDLVDMNEFLPTALTVVRSLLACTINRVNTRKMIYEYDKTFGCIDLYGKTPATKRKNLEKAKDATIKRYLKRIYEFVYKNKICPWINDESKMQQEGGSRSNIKYAKMNVELGLYYTILFRYNRNKNKTKK